ncbi:hypothetical protein C8Q77DRAFT_105111 [Trametes polyzona]|nr:hypothetical protein C8Q77DRAFT_105111 [Trametes polyzona]
MVVVGGKEVCCVLRRDATMTICHIRETPFPAVQPTMPAVRAGASCTVCGYSIFAQIVPSSRPRRASGGRNAFASRSRRSSLLPVLRIRPGVPEGRLYPRVLTVRPRVVSSAFTLLRIASSVRRCERPQCLHPVGHSPVLLPKEFKVKDVKSPPAAGCATGVGT